MNWPFFILGIVLFVLGALATIFFSACALPLRREPKSPQFSIRTRRQPGETDSDVYDRLLNESPTHQAELKNKK